MIGLFIGAIRPVWFRGKYFLVSKLASRSGEREICLFGVRVRLNLADAMQRWIYMGVFESQETAKVRRLLQPGMVVVDAGANIGYYTLLSAERVGPTGRVFAVEPSRLGVERLTRTVVENGMTQVQVVPIGLSDHEGEVTLHVPPASAGHHNPTMLDVADASFASEVVPVRTLDACLDEWGVDRVDLLKIDVEGFEPRVLRGAARSLAEGRIGAILAEFNDVALREAGSSATALLRELREAGFRDLDGSTSMDVSEFETRLLIHSTKGLGVLARPDSQHRDPS
ncbi:MAG: FkbM family methyltransferase [Isosphaeraceae bacterium]